MLGQCTKLCSSRQAESRSATVERCSPLRAAPTGWGAHLADIRPVKPVVVRRLEHRELIWGAAFSHLRGPARVVAPTCGRSTRTTNARGRTGGRQQRLEHGPSRCLMRPVAGGCGRGGNRRNKTVCTAVRAAMRQQLSESTRGRRRGCTGGGTGAGGLSPTVGAVRWRKAIESYPPLEVLGPRERAVHRRLGEEDHVAGLCHRLVDVLTKLLAVHHGLGDREVRLVGSADHAEAPTPLVVRCQHHRHGEQ